jgi:hypothetical protein
MLFDGRHRAGVLFDVSGNRDGLDIFEVAKPAAFAPSQELADGVIVRDREKPGAKRIATPDLRSCDDRGAQLFLQDRTRVLNEEWRSTLSRWYPWMQETCDAKAA